MLWSGFHALEGLVMKIKQFRDFTTESVLNCLKKKHLKHKKYLGIYNKTFEKKTNKIIT